MWDNKPMKCVVAVSGGVDSVVLLDELVRAGDYDLVVAHFDHGMREDSAGDARFVEALARRYGLPFEHRREELAGANEDLARRRRYNFLFSVAEKYRGKLATAHHLDDLVETVVFNLQRGTRWRGLAVLSDQRISRPLLKRTKSELIEIAKERQLEWVEDETNQQDIYTRNRLRRLLGTLPDDNRQKIYSLWQAQLKLAREIDREFLASDFPILSRYFVAMIDGMAAREIIYRYIFDECDVSLLTAQLDRLILAVKVGRPGTVWQIGQGVEIKLSHNHWEISLQPS